MKCIPFQIKLCLKRVLERHTEKAKKVKFVQFSILRTFTVYFNFWREIDFSVQFAKEEGKHDNHKILPGNYRGTHHKRPRTIISFTSLSGRSLANPLNRMKLLSFSSIFINKITFRCVIVMESRIMSFSQSFPRSLLPMKTSFKGSVALATATLTKHAVCVGPS